MIQTFGLNKYYGKFQAVQDLNLEVPNGEVFGFLGLNGAGKTTVMRMLCGLLRPSSGYSRIGEIDIHGPDDTHSLIGSLSFVSQEMKFFEQASLEELLVIYAVLAGTTVEYGKAFAIQVGVPLNRPCGRLSPGQQRKAQLAIALLKRPSYLLLDEPTAGLDPQGVAEVRDIIRLLHAAGTTVFLSSHILGEVQTLCTSVGILHNGKLSYQGPIEESYTINISGDVHAAIEILEKAGIPSSRIPEGIRVKTSEANLPVIIQMLAGQFQVGLVQPDNLEGLFSHAIGKKPEGIK